MSDKRMKRMELMVDRPKGEGGYFACERVGMLERNFELNP